MGGGEGLEDDWALDEDGEYQGTAEEGACQHSAATIVAGHMFDAVHAIHTNRATQLLALTTAIGTPTANTRGRPTEPLTQVEYEACLERVSIR